MNSELGLISASKADVIIDSCHEIMAGRHHEHLVLDLIQVGAGTSTNMIANKLIANLVLQKLGRRVGDYQ
ncbi:hypothetical protein [Phaeobacter sp. JH20_39]|uniref:hypothetical protein n=1 Tax=Phaeobacter sp. JH20_39 TaxID=3112496 RepID=UPI003A896B36